MNTHVFLRSSLIVSSLLLFACDSEGPRPPETTPSVEVVPFVAPIKVVDADELAALPAVRLGERPLTVIAASDNDENYDLYNLGDVVRLQSGSLVVNSNAAPRLYDRTGRFIRSLGRSGAGPGEYRQVVRVGRLTGDTIATFDNMLGRISIFSPLGEFVRSVPVPGDVGQSLGRFNEYGEFIGERPLRRRRASGAKYRDTLQLIARDVRSGSSRTIGFVGGAWMVEGAGSAPLTPFPRTATGGDRFYLTSGDLFEVQVYEETRPKHLLKVDLPLQRVTDDALAKWGKYDAAAGDEAAYRRYVENVRRHAVSHRSQLHGLLADQRGFLWTRGQALSDQDRSSAPWIIFDRDGQPVARFAPPKARFLSSVGPDFVILVKLGEDMPSTVEVWPLVYP